MSDAKWIRVPLLTEEEAVTWLYALAQREQSSATAAEQNAVRILVKDLGYLPLAIQAAVYLRERPTVSIAGAVGTLFTL